MSLNSLAFITVVDKRKVTTERVNNEVITIKDRELLRGRHCCSKKKNITQENRKRR